MKKLMSFLGLVVFVGSAAFAQSSHSVTLTWTASPDGGTVNVYRAASSCSGAPSFTLLKAGVVAAGPYVDSTVGVGAFCFYVSAVVNGAESLPSNSAPATVLPQAPATLVAVPK